MQLTYYKGVGVALQILIHVAFKKSCTRSRDALSKLLVSNNQQRLL